MKRIWSTRARRKTVPPKSKHFASDPLSTPLMRARLMLLWTPSQCQGDAVLILQKALAGGVDCVQVREKTATTRELYQLALLAEPHVRRGNAQFIINDRVDVAVACGADGAHLGQDDLPIADARKFVKNGFLIGLSTHSLDQVRGACDRGADYLGFGPMFPTATKPAESPIGPADLDSASLLARRPVFAIGGLTAGRILQIGARRAAISSAILNAEDPEAAAAEIRAALERNGASDPDISIKNI